ncbi:MAG: hypothetical protein KIT27_09245 [Legionellales bacterium]|nr:hypothetical protein [Legionellales bacterium]
MRYYLLMVLFSCIFSINFCYAWSERAYVIVTQMALNQLSKPDQLRYEHMAKLIEINLPLKQRNYLKQHFKTASLFARLSVLPSFWKMQPLGEVYQQLNGTLPSSLTKYKEQDTQNWHAINFPYPNLPQCNSIKTPNLVWAINHFKKGLKESYTSNTKVINLVFLANFITDVHQPLRTHILVDQQCKSNNMGEDVCLIPVGEDNCDKTLLDLWEDGAGYLTSTVNISYITEELQKRYPAKQFSQELNQNSAEAWAKESVTYFPKIYGFRDMSRKSYDTEVINITKKQLALAAYRLAAILKQN